MANTFFPCWLYFAAGDSVVPKVGLEPTRVKHPLDFESSASTNSATLACECIEMPKTVFQIHSIFSVREKGLEPLRLAALVPKTSVYTNFTTLAFCDEKRI